MNKKNMIFGTLMIVMIVIGAMGSFIEHQQININNKFQEDNDEETITEPVEERKWQPVPMGDADPGSGASGVLRVYIVQTGQTYTDNLTSDAGYVLAYGDTNNVELAENGSTVNYSETFDIVIEVRWNKTHAYNSSNSTWTEDWVKANITCATFSLTNQSMDEYNITSSENYVYMHYVMDNSGSGYTISRGQTVPSCRFYFESYYA